MVMRKGRLRAEVVMETFMTVKTNRDSASPGCVRSENSSCVHECVEGRCVDRVCVCKPDFFGQDCSMSPFLHSAFLPEVLTQDLPCTRQQAGELEKSTSSFLTQIVQSQVRPASSAAYQSEQAGVTLAVLQGMSERGHLLSRLLCRQQGEQQ
eukprot:445427-Hanusia_phi.AAC.2